MEKASVTPLADAYRLINPGCVVLVSVGDDERDNVFPVTWNMPVKKDPPIIALVSSKRHFSFSFIERTGEFGINIPDENILDALYGCGRTSGRDGADKFAQFKLTRQRAQQIRAPLVAEAVANLECRVQQTVDLGESALIIANILEATASTEHFQDNQWIFDNGLRLLHHLSGERFCTSEHIIKARLP